MSKTTWMWIGNACGTLIAYVFLIVFVVCVLMWIGEAVGWYFSDLSVY